LLFNLDNSKLFCLQAHSCVNGRKKRPKQIAAMRCCACRPDAALKHVQCMAGISDYVEENISAEQFEKKTNSRFFGPNGG
jgi:hypothetical protein